jgi:diadenylate cyclase
MEFLTQFAGEVGLVGFLDIGLMSLLVYGLLVWLRRTKRAGLILWGMFILGLIYLLSVQFGLVLTAQVLRSFSGAFLIMLVVIFQEDLRQLFEQIAHWSLSRRFSSRNAGTVRLPPVEVSVLVRTLADLAGSRTGALVVLCGQMPIARHVDGGIDVHGRLSEALLKSIFDPHSIGHDGAVIILRDVIEKLGVHLPLAHDPSGTGPLGTRHAAALGLSERTDALCLVVSEERGTISVARRGRLEVMNGHDCLGEVIEAFYEELSPTARANPLRSLLLANYREKILAVCTAATLWIALAYRTAVVLDHVEVTVTHSTAPPGLVAVRLSPTVVLVDVSGPRRVLNHMRTGEVKLELRLDGVTQGMQMIAIQPESFNVPDGVEVSDFSPRQVLVEVDVLTPPTNTRTLRP